jgi:hypothetical protein
MAITVNGLQWLPLYWMHHDCWKYQVPNLDGTFTDQEALRSQHMWLMGYNWDRSNGDAFSGAMNFSVRA